MSGSPGAVAPEASSGRSKEGRRGDGVRVELAEPIEPGAKLFAEDGDLTIDDEGAGREAGGDLTKTVGRV
jgi:hypothetical protein